MYILCICAHTLNIRNYIHSYSQTRPPLPELLPKSLRRRLSLGISLAFVDLLCQFGVSTSAHTPVSWNMEMPGMVCLNPSEVVIFGGSGYPYAHLYIHLGTKLPRKWSFLGWGNAILGQTWIVRPWHHQSVTQCLHADVCWSRQGKDRKARPKVVEYPKDSKNKLETIKSSWWTNLLLDIIILMKIWMIGQPLWNPLRLGCSTTHGGIPVVTRIHS